MKTFVFIALTFTLAVCGRIPIPAPQSHKSALLGAKECTWGPSYWCQNLTAAADCHATKHCVQTVWKHKQVEEDTSSVCQVCLDMVKQARDQLESNETQEEIKEVFEGSCALLHIKPIVKECDKIADNYIPDLIDTLASQMNPQVVCSVAGLCNNVRFQQLQLDSGKDVNRKQVAAPSTCDGCHTVVGLLENKFQRMNRDQVLQAFLHVCGKMSSLSDACSNIVITHFTEIYTHLQENFNPNEVCLMAGECSAQFHTHASKVEITPMSDVGYVAVQSDNLPCDLCEQLVSHLRDLLVANTTEDEFKKVLEGLCNQTKSFKDECLSLVGEYYGLIYNFLVSELNGTYVCSLAGICPQSSKFETAPINPLLPISSEEKALEITPPSHTNQKINMGLENSPIEILETPQQAQLPIERLTPPHMQIVYNTQVCTFCEYFLHYVQEAITNPSTETKIKKIVDEACYKLPSTVNDTCVQFVDTYGDALVAILAQEIDPSTVCPLLRVCPAADVKDVEIFMQQSGDNSKCPLCLFAVSKLEDMVKDKKTEANIKEALNNLCSHLSSNLKQECQDFVNTYADELVDMLVADLNPQEVCVYLKLCDDKQPAPAADNGAIAELETNQIHDYTYNGEFVKDVSTASPQCVLCEFIMKEIDDKLKDKSDEDEIKKVVHGICNDLPKTVRTDCNNYVNQYADTIIQLLASALEPSEVCSVMNLCTAKRVVAEVKIGECIICEAVTEIMYRIMANPNVDHNVNHVLEKACRALPSRDQEKCVSFIETYGSQLYHLILRLSNPRLACREIGLCFLNEAHYRTRRGLIGSNKCSWGPGYWCESLSNANECGRAALQHCQKKIWLAEAP